MRVAFELVLDLWSLVVAVVVVVSVEMVSVVNILVSALQDMLVASLVMAFHDLDMMMTVQESFHSFHTVLKAYNAVQIQTRSSGYSMMGIDFHNSIRSSVYLNFDHRNCINCY